MSVGRCICRSLCVWRCYIGQLPWVGRCGLVAVSVSRFVWNRSLSVARCGPVALCSLEVGRFVSVAVDRFPGQSWWVDRYVGRSGSP